MHVHTLECELLVSRPLDETFRVFEDPRNLALITPPWMGFEILTRDPVMRKGLRIDYRFRWLGLPMVWKTLITEYEPPFLFVDEALKSPYTLWRHRHTFRETAEGTAIQDHVDYALPFGIAGRMVNRVLVAKQLKEIFEYRQKQVAELLGGSAVPLRAPVAS